MRSFYFILSNSFSKNRQAMLSVLVLCAFLCATLSHSAHSESTQDNIELQECKLCQHSIDNPPNNLTVKLVAITSFDSLEYSLQNALLASTIYLIPQLRAPPFQ